MTFSLLVLRNKMPVYCQPPHPASYSLCFSYLTVLHWTVITIFKGQKKLLSSYLHSFLYIPVFINLRFIPFPVQLVLNNISTKTPESVLRALGIILGLQRLVPNLIFSLYINTCPTHNSKLANILERY